MPLERPCEFQPIKFADTDFNFTLTNEADPESVSPNILVREYIYDEIDTILEEDEIERSSNDWS